jgi:hypothetical protein
MESFEYDGTCFGFDFPPVKMDFHPIGDLLCFMLPPGLRLGMSMTV